VSGWWVVLRNWAYINEPLDPKDVLYKAVELASSFFDLTGRVHAKSHPFKKMKREIAAVVVLCAACVEGASRLDGHKGKRTLILSVRDRNPEKKKGNF
jgi:hypothetical protein